MWKHSEETSIELISLKMPCQIVSGSKEQLAVHDILTHRMHEQYTVISTFVFMKRKLTLFQIYKTSGIAVTVDNTNPAMTGFVLNPTTKEFWLLSDDKIFKEMLSNISKKVNIELIFRRENKN